MGSRKWDVVVIIDELIVVLGLDTRKFTDGQRDALASFKKGKEAATDFGKQVEQSSLKMTEVFTGLKAGIAGAIGLLAGGEIGRVINHITEMDAATGRWAKTINTSVPNLSAWQGMVRQVGGAASEATSALSTLQQEINNVRQGGGMFEGGFASLMNQAGVSLQDDADTSLRKIQSFISGQVKAGKMNPSEASTFLNRVPGMNQSMINVMLGDLQKLEAAAKAAGTATKESADEAIKYQESLTQLGLSAEGLERVLTIKLTPSLVQFLDRTKQIIQEFSNGQFISPDSWLGKLLGVASGKSTVPMAGSSATSAPRTNPGGTTRGDRNNNPGNMEYGAFARAHGATSSDGRFAVFPDWQTGAAAQQALISGKGYAGLTLHEFAARYAEGAPAWERTVGGALGLGPNDIVNNQDPRLADAIRRAEGTGARGSANARAGRGGNSSTTTNDVDIHKIEIHAPNATDAEGLSSELGGALKRQSLIAPINTGLV